MNKKYVTTHMNSDISPKLLVEAKTEFKCKSLNLTLLKNRNLNSFKVWDIWTELGGSASLMLY